eukprot:TRINITY_DN33832_c0_g1_i1.p1 TRINITY_DN33832_c0_g1~~TRINITY_DN33832_c0_g1_i1.p1  ORF type:complete len:174 (+),score=42.83 TRINITY_DN33832_c0_g1_i1:2-523(+)
MNGRQNFLSSLLRCSIFILSIIIPFLSTSSSFISAQIIKSDGAGRILVDSPAVFRDDILVANISFLSMNNRLSSLSSFYNVRSYGAVGDGVSDDTPFFNAAITAMMMLRNTGMLATLYIPGGRYKIVSPLVFNSSALDIQISVMGEGLISRILWASNTNLIVFNVGVQTGFTL